MLNDSSSWPWIVSTMVVNDGWDWCDKGSVVDFWNVKKMGYRILTNSDIYIHLWYISICKYTTQCHDQNMHTCKTHEWLWWCILTELMYIYIYIFTFICTQMKQYKKSGHQPRASISKWFFTGSAMFKATKLSVSPKKGSLPKWLANGWLNSKA